MLNNNYTQQNRTAQEQTHGNTPRKPYASPTETLRFDEWLDLKRSRVEAETIAEAEAIAGTGYTFPANFRFGDNGYFDHSEAKQKKKVGYQSSFTNGKPTITVVHIGKSTQYVDLSYDIYQRDATGKPLAKRTPPKIIQQTTNTTKKCVSCGRDHDRQADNCYHCYIASLWPVALPVGNHPYLNAKEIPAEVANLAGVRAYGDMLLIPFSAGNGWQVIYANGGKFFAVEAGTMNGSFCAIGNISNTIYVTEGFATGSSAYLALGQGVVVAFNAGNLANVVATLRDDYPEAKIIILADNDIRPPGSDKVNTGLVVSTEVAIEHHCQIALPPTETKADWNDYHLANGLEATRQAIADNTFMVSSELYQLLHRQAVRQGLTTAKRLQENGLTAEAIELITEAGVTVRFIDETELTPASLGSIDQQSVMVKSGMGTGKTSGVAKALIANSESAIVVNHLISLARNASKVLDCDLYLESDIPTQKMVVVVNSLRKFINDYQLLFIDELEGLLKAIADGSHIADNERLEIFNTLNQQVDRCQTKIYASADIDAVSLKWWLDNDKAADKVLVINEASRLTDKTINVFEDDKALLDHLKADLQAGRKALIACDTKNFARMIGDNASGRLAGEFSEALKGKRVTWISSENSSNKEIVEFIAGLAGGSYQETDVLCYTPTIGEGVSIEAKHFDTHYFIGGGVVDVFKVLQMIGRDRTATTINVYLPNKGLGVPATFSLEQFEGEQKAKTADYLSKAKDNLPEAIYQQALSAIELTGLDSHIAFSKFQYHKLNRDYRRNFMRFAMAAGYQVNVINLSGSMLLKNELEAVKLARYEDIAGADKLGDIEAEALENNADSLTSSEQYELERYRIAKAYGVEVDCDLLALDNGGRTRATIARLAELQLNDKVLAAIDYDRNCGIVAYQQSYALIRKEFFGKVCEAVGIVVTGNGLCYAEAKYSHKDDFSDFRQYLIENLDALNGAGLGIAKLTLKRINKTHLVINEALRLLGVAKNRTNCRQIGNYYRLSAKFGDIVDNAVSIAKDKMLRRYDKLCAVFGSSYIELPESHTQPEPQPEPATEPATIYARLNDSQRELFTFLWQFFAYAEVEATFSQFAGE